jgi:hypothetical protein
MAIQWYKNANSADKITFDYTPGSINTLTIAAWIYPTETQPTYAGVCISRTDGAQGLCFNNAGELAYYWEGTTDEYNDGFVLTPTNNQWNLVIVVITPTAATGYLATSLGGSLTTGTTNTKAHGTKGPVAWQLGHDSNNSARTFRGAIAEVGIWTSALDSTARAALKDGDAPGLVDVGNLKVWKKLLTTHADELGNTSNEAYAGDLPEVFGSHPGVSYGSSSVFNIRRFAHVPGCVPGMPLRSY